MSRYTIKRYKKVICILVLLQYRITYNVYFEVTNTFALELFVTGVSS